ncbi:response regulator receiver-modulated signal transduction diguanylate cyclase [Oleiphilus messinensis]|uniref:Response regulator receiver-modulated signal transduction diguanylate cyclase n=1 Tax=Oleiphilus messinensis TaxID=141451 RepID=A0A1Y0I5Q0_9GAMM|nr:GGDEF domain-containing response regulator [Oleiphilus messinensis]ARU55539.1 response regulator receiver-modulated signal transduction diguanylate cyclase [Oleiphilus messinensis]
MVVEDADAPPDRDQDRADNQGEARVINVLMVEDDYDDFYLIREILKQNSKRQYRLSRALTLEDCVSQVQSTPPDIILLDLGLQDSSGLATLEKLLKSGIQQPVIVLTGVNDEELGENAIKIGAEDYLPKEEVSKTLLSRSINYGIERHRLTAELQQKASEDALTGLPNRSALFERIEVLISNTDRAETKLAIALLDLDGFKEVNDTLGHQTGDDLLRQIAARLRKSLRRSDMAARYGGDEFVLVFTNYHSESELMEVVQRKLNILTQPIRLYVNGEVQEVTIGASVGLAEWRASMTAQQIVNNADDAMYASKKNGKNQVTMATSLQS